MALIALFPIGLALGALRTTTFPALFLVSLFDRGDVWRWLVEMGLVKVLVELPLFEYGSLNICACDLLGYILELPFDALLHVVLRHTLVLVVLSLQIMDDIIDLLYQK